MAKRKPETSEYLPEWDEGTYQTGKFKEPRGSSGLVVILLLAVIFLGGLCSVMGIANIRLLARIAQNEHQTVPIAQESQATGANNDSVLDQLNLPTPVVPENLRLTLLMADTALSQAETTASYRDGEHLQAEHAQSLVQVQCLTHFNSTENGVGLVLSADGLILTNSHVVDAAKRIFVTLHDGTMHRAALVGCDNFSDLAVLYIDRQDLTPARFSSNQNLQVGQPTYAFEASSDPILIRESSVFNIGRTFATSAGAIHLLQTCEGGTTGPVFDSFGHVIGFQVGIISDYFTTDDIKGIGMVVPTGSIRQILDQLMESGFVSGQPHLGLEVEAISKLYQQYWQLPGGLLLTGISSSSDAAAKGLMEGDILLALDGKPVHERSDLYTILYNHKAGDTLIAVIRRDNQQFTVTLTIEDNSKNFDHEIS